MKLKTTAMWELNGFLPEMHLFHADGNVNWAKQMEFKALYNMNNAFDVQSGQGTRLRFEVQGEQKIQKNEIITRGAVTVHLLLGEEEECHI